MKAEITNIKIRIGDREIEFTSEEARKVHDELSKLFAVAIPLAPAPTIVPVPYPVPTYPELPVSPWRPIWVDPTYPTWRPSWEIMCGGNTGSPANTLSIIC